MTSAASGMAQIEAANSLMHRLPGVLVEIIGGQMRRRPVLTSLIRGC